RAQDQTLLAATDFQFTIGSSSVGATLSKASCACPQNVVIGLSITSDGLAKLTSSDSLTATLMTGAACDQDSSTCLPLGSADLTLSSSSASAMDTLSTADLFNSVPGGAGCATTSSTRLWAIVRADGALIQSHPSLPISFGGAAPVAPTGLTALTAD